MGGTVIETKSEKLIRKGREAGKAEEPSPTQIASMLLQQRINRRIGRMV